MNLCDIVAFLSLQANQSIRNKWMTLFLQCLLARTCEIQWASEVFQFLPKAIAKSSEQK